ncbi:hypothetical protein Q1695_014861 [Nippostrongylus brasiliensis]|nr:hypothetical protein Q1695_014861 [Nippostrongylus brasiliensis]
MANSGNCAVMRSARTRRNRARSPTAMTQKKRRHGNPVRCGVAAGVRSTLDINGSLWRRSAWHLVDDNVYPLEWVQVYADKGSTKDAIGSSVVEHSKRYSTAEGL